MTEASAVIEALQASENRQEQLLVLQQSWRCAEAAPMTLPEAEVLLSKLAKLTTLREQHRVPSTLALRSPPTPCAPAWSGAGSACAASTRTRRWRLSGGRPRRRPPGPGSKRKLETGSGEESEAARLCRADLRAAEAGLAREVVVPLGHRAAVVEGLRRVLLGSKPPPDPEAYWASKGPGGRFPFPEHLSAMRAELAAEEATKRGHA